MSKDWATIIVAAGSGQRFGGEIPKQYARMANRPVLAWTLESLGNQGQTVIVIDPKHKDLFDPLLENQPHIKTVSGGLTRQQSVLAGLNALNNNNPPPRHVLIHDAARPLVDAQSIARLKTAIEAGKASATLALPVVDTLMRGSDIIDRDGVQAIQTPQAFDFDLILDAHRAAKNSYTDDASLVQAEKGVNVTFVQGHADNFKITTADDLARAEKLLLAHYTDTRTGLGFDVHRFGPGNKIRLFGCDIPSTQSLIGHSDADAGLHAIADAILGTIGAGDIGMLFPPTDPQWKGMDSALIVEAALDLLRQKGGVLTHVDIMLMSELPKIAPHRDAIVTRLSQLLALPADAIGLKATTTEKIGAIGRGEGLAVQVIVTVRLRR